MSDLIVRCSSIGRLMSKPENADLDPLYVTPEVKAIIAKTKRSDEEKSVLEEVRRKSLSAGGKSHVRELVREAIYGFEPADLQTRPILKGRAVEQQCIELLSRVTGRPLVKNAERRTNGLISGECDVWDEPLRMGRDVKAPWSMETMPIALADCYDSGYLWQMHGYIWLWCADRWSVDYVLESTPEELIGIEPQALHYVDHIPEHLRVTSWLVERDAAAESLITDKVTAARRYYREVLAEFDRTHGGALPPVETSPAIPDPHATAKTAMAPDQLPAELF